MALSPDEYRSGGQVFDGEGRRRIVLGGGAGLAAGEHRSGGIVVDQDGREVISAASGGITAAGLPWAPSHNGLKAASMDPTLATTNSALAGGFVWVRKIWVPETITVVNFELGVVAAGATLTAGQNFAGIYSSAGTLIAKTGDLSGVWNSTGMKTAALTAEAGQSLTIQGGPGVWIYGAVLSNGTTQPSLMVAPLLATAVAAGANLKLAAGDGFRSAFTTAGSRTALPATLPALTATQHMWFMGLS